MKEEKRLRTEEKGRRGERGRDGHKRGRATEPENGWERRSGIKREN